MTMIHMDPEEVRRLVERIKSASAQLDSHCQSIQREVENLPWQGDSRTAFLYECSETIRALRRSLEEKNRMAAALTAEIRQWEAAAERLDGGANAARPTNPISASAAAAAPIAAAVAARDGAEVMGAQAVNLDSKQYDQMSWNDRFAELHRLRAELERANQLDIGTIEKKIAEIDQQIAEAEQALQTALQEEDKLINRVLRQDGQSLSDQYKQVADNYNRQIDELKKLRARWQADADTYHGKEQLQANLAALTGKINEGIDPGKPTPQWMRNQLAGCTNYVASKRDVSQFNGGHPGDAGLWAGQAESAGFEVGAMPVKGSIIVFNKESGYTNNSSGHVGYVEEVIMTKNGYTVKFSQASPVEVNGKILDGKHTPVKMGTYTIPFDGNQNVKFIYDK